MNEAAILRLAPAVAMAALVGPIAGGLIWTVAPAFGWFPAIGGTRVSLDGWAVLFDAPGLASALKLTVRVGVGTTILALALAAGFCAAEASGRHSPRLGAWLAPLVASPHSAVALGFAFLIIPSGWFIRLLSPWVAGLEQPPPLVTIRDPAGWTFLAGLLLKEVPYLVLMMQAASAQVPVANTMAAARSLGQSAPVAWLKAVFPLIYPQIRLPVFAVLAFSLSAVDVGLILAPGNPPPLAILAMRWFSGYDLRLYFTAAAAASLQLAMTVVAIAAWLLVEKLIVRVGPRWIACGMRDPAVGAVLTGLGIAATAIGALGLLSIAIMAVWSIAGSWWFPHPVPQRVVASNWIAQAPRAAQTAGTTAIVALLSTAVSLVLSLACLENEQRRRIRPGATAMWLIYLPLLVPQIAFLFGVQVMFVQLGIDGSLLAVAWAHLLFVMPYVFLSLAEPYRALDPRIAASAAALGASPLRVFATIKLPLLVRPTLVALAVGFSVSVGQYLPTMFAGAGRVATVTTEAVALAGSADRRIIGVFAVLQTALPLLVYGCALAVPAVVFRNRRELLR